MWACSMVVSSLFRSESTAAWDSVQGMGQIEWSCSQCSAQQDRFGKAVVSSAQKQREQCSLAIIELGDDVSSEAPEGLMVMLDAVEQCTVSIELAAVFR
jgi:hypothetical protein